MTALAFLEHINIVDGAIHIKAGCYTIPGCTFTIGQDMVFQVPSSPVVWIENEPLKLSSEVPQGFNVGTPLAGPNARDINALDALIPETVILRKVPSGAPLEAGRDYLLSARHALLGIGPHSCVSPEDTVFAEYAYAMMRLDSIFLDAEGNLGFTTGIPHITAPVPPRIPEDCIRLANIFRPYHATTLEKSHIYPVLESSDAARTESTADRIPNTLRKLKNGERVVIACWGDSVTAGGNASEPRFRYTIVFHAGLRRMFPRAQIEMHNISVGGSSSINWLYPEQCPFSNPDWQDELDFGRITRLKPDLVTLEFVNDAGLEPAIRDTAYAFIHQSLKQINAELILITPHFTHPSWMGIEMCGLENRSYVSFLKDFATSHHFALADASSRWAHLWKEGIPYLTLLHNSVNHPEDRGHHIFAEELWKCFKD